MEKKQLEKKCHKCKKPIPFMEKECTSCGAKQVSPIIGILIFVVLAIVLVITFSGGEDNNIATEINTPLTIEQKIEKQFTAWDGSHIKLKQYVKELLKDPNSFNHIKTSFTPRPLTDKAGNEYITVNMKYRAKNSFGGYTVETYKAFFDIDGNPIRIEEWANY